MSKSNSIKPIPGWPGYYARTDGTIWSTHVRYGSSTHLVPLKEAHQLKASLAGCGYRMVTLCRNKKKRGFRVHHLVLETFRGPRRPGQECRHFDGDKLNNALDNLIWGTHTENAGDSLRHGTQVRGEQNGGSKLTAVQVREIRTRFANGESQTAIAAEFGINQRTVNRIVNRVHWKHVD